MKCPKGSYIPTLLCVSPAILNNSAWGAHRKKPEYRIYLNSIQSHKQEHVDMANRITLEVTLDLAPAGKRKR
jgi:hypothetical protein